MQKIQKWHLTIDREQEGWDGHVGFVPNYVKELNMSTDKVALICGPPIMIKFTLQGLQEIGFDKTQVVYHAGAPYEMRRR